MSAASTQDKTWLVVYGISYGKFTSKAEAKQFYSLVSAQMSGCKLYKQIRPQ